MEEAIQNNLISFFDNYSSMMAQAAEDLEEYDNNLSTAIDRIIKARISTLKSENKMDEIQNALLEETLKQTIKTQSEYGAAGLEDKYKSIKKMDVTGGVNSPSIRA